MCLLDKNDYDIIAFSYLIFPPKYINSDDAIGGGAFLK